VCTFNEDAAGSFFAVIVVTVLSTMFSVPPLMFFDYLSSNVLVASIKGSRKAGINGAAEADHEKDRKASSTSKAAKVIALATHEEDHDEDEIASVEDIAMTVSSSASQQSGKSKTFNGLEEVSNPLSKQLSPSRLRVLHTSMQHSMSKVLTARQRSKEEKRQRDEEQNQEVKEETRKAVSIDRDVAQRQGSKRVAS
jgi:hypothetical protein